MLLGLKLQMVLVLFFLVSVVEEPTTSPPNNPPRIIGRKTKRKKLSKKKKTVKFRIQAVDPDGDKLTLTLTKNTKSAFKLKKTGNGKEVLSFSPKRKKKGTYRARVKVTDGQYSDKFNAVITVKGPPPPSCIRKVGGRCTVKEKKKCCKGSGLVCRKKKGVFKCVKSCQKVASSCQGRTTCCKGLICKRKQMCGRIQAICARRK